MEVITKNDTDFLNEDRTRERGRSGEDIYKYKLVRNVKSYEFVDFCKWNITLLNSCENKIESNQNIQYYLIIDTIFHDAFAHWVFECAVYLPLFHKLKELYPNLKLYLKSKKNFKILFTTHLGINQDDITYTIDINNICIFPAPITSLNDNCITEEYKLLIDELVNKLNIPLNTKSICNLFSPRGGVENFWGNHRIHNTSDIETVFVNQDDDNMYKILYTDKITSLNEQINIISMTKNVILSDGSAFLVNGFFCNNSKIIILGNIVLSQVNSYIKMKYLYDYVNNKNEIICLPYLHGNFNNSDFYYNDILSLLN